MTPVHSRALNDCVWTNFVMLLSVPVCAVMVTGIQKVLRPGRWGRRRHLLSSVCSNNHARIRRFFSESCVGRCDYLTSLELIWVQSVWVHRFDLWSALLNFSSENATCLFFGWGSTLLVWIKHPQLFPLLALLVVSMRLQCFFVSFNFLCVFPVCAPAPTHRQRHS